MKADRWRQVEQLYDAAIALPVAEREGFVQEACAGEEDLRHELLSLLDAEQKAGGFMESPALDLAARRIAQEPPEAGASFIGRQLRPYEIEKLLGAGGMGEVYLAHDAKLERRVALKILPPRFVSDPEHVRRFAREARHLRPQAPQPHHHLRHWHGGRRAVHRHGIRRRQDRARPD